MLSNKFNGTYFTFTNPTVGYVLEIFLCYQFAADIVEPLY